MAMSARRMGISSFALMNDPLVSAYAEDVTTLRMVIQTVKIGPLGGGFFRSLLVRYKCPEARLRAFGNTRYSALMSTCKTIVLALYRMVAFGYVSK